MASTQQSAQEFLRNSRTLLTESLSNCDPVIEAVDQCNLFSKDELNSIKSAANSEDRLKIMLDMVVSNGEEACYKFLKILERKRSEVFPRSDLKYDLHHWISCFSFQDEPQSQTANKADPCTVFQGNLRWKVRQILDEKWNQSMNFLKNEPKRKPFMYIPLVLDTDSSTISKLKKNKAYKKTRSKKLKTYIPTDKKMLSPKHLLLNDEKSILLVGKPGVGKTTVALEILRLWTEEKSIQVSYMFYFDEPLMRVLSQSSFPQTLKDLLFHNDLSPNEASDQILENIESNSENVVLIFDGIMDVIGNSVIKQLMDKVLLKDAKILTTCRPEAEDTGYLSDWPSYRVEVQGFNHESIREYFKWMLGTEHDSSACALDNPELFSLCSVPLYAFIVTACISISPIESRNKPFTITEMYVRIFRFCMKQHGHQNVELLDKYISDNKKDIMHLALASYQAMQEKTVNLANVDHKDKSVQNAFLTTMQSRNTSTPSSKVSVFLHNTMQEFWAALFLILNPEKISHVLEQCQSNEDGKYLKYIIPFLIGLLSDKLFELIKCLVPSEKIQAIHTKYFEQIVDTFLYTKEQNEEGDCEQFVEADNILFLCRCLYEYQSTEACRLFLTKVENELDLQGETLDPHQCCAVSYVISQSENQNVELDLQDCNISELGLKLILGSLKNLKSLGSSSKLQSEMWRVSVGTEQFLDFDSLFRLFSFEMHLFLHGKPDQKVFQRLGEVIKQKRPQSVHLYLHVNKELITRPLQQAIFESLPNIASIRILPDVLKIPLEAELYLQGAVYEMQTGHRCVRDLLLVLRNNQIENFKEQCEFLLKLDSHAKNMNVRPILQPVFHALPPTWVVQPSKSAMSLLLQTMKVFSLKKPAELCVTYKQDELQFFLQCMPYVTEIRFSVTLEHAEGIRKIVKIVANLFILASERGDETLRRLSTACSYPTFPFAKDYKDMQSSFLLDLFTHLRESSSAKRTLPLLQSILKVAPTVWVLDLPNLENTNALPEIMRLQPFKRPVELRGWVYDMDKLRIFQDCVPYISHLCCAEQFFQTVCEVLSADSEWNPKPVSELIRSLGYSIYLMKMLPSRLCKAVGRVFEQLDSKDDLSLSLLPQNISCQGSGLLFSNVKRLQTLRVNEIAVAKLARLVRADEEINSITVEELSLVLSSSQLPERTLCKLLGNLSSLLKFWTVYTLNLSELKIEAHLLISLLCHQGPLSIRFHKDTLQQLAEVVYDAQDENLTRLYLEKIDGDLSPCSLSWDIFDYLIQSTKKQVKLDLQEGKFDISKIPSLLTVLDTVCFKRISPQFVKAALKEIYQKRGGHLIVKLARSSADLINLCMRELDSTDCKALCFALQYSDGVKLNLSNCVIPNNETENIVKLLHRVSHLRIDRKLLLTFLHASKDMEKQGYSTSGLLTAMNHKLDFSFHSSIGSGRFSHDNGDLLNLSVMDFIAISSAIQTSACDTELILYDCQADDSALEILFTVLHKVHLRLGKSLLCQFLTLILSATMAMSLKWASSFSKALGKELDLSGTPVNYRTCESLQLVLDYTEELEHLNLSHCQLTDACLDLVVPHLHKILNLNLSGNDITDKGVQRLRSALDENSITRTICLCDNQITEMALVNEEACYKSLHANTKTWTQQQGYISRHLESKVMTEKTPKTFIKEEEEGICGFWREDLMETFMPELTVNKGIISYRFKCNTGGLFLCRATGLVFGMKGSGCVEYSVVHWDMRLLINTRYKPAGPLFDIKTTTGEIYELHLPHCETHVDEIGNLSVVHIHKDTLEFLTPVKMTKTHLAVNVCGLSRFAVVDEKSQNNKIVSGQVLLFLEPDMSEKQKRIWVFLLPRNVPVSEIKQQQREYVFIQTSSDCKLRLNAKYTLISKKAKRVQPKVKFFKPLYGADHHPTFEVFLDKGVTGLRIKILCKIKENKILFKNTWNRWIILKPKEDNHTQMGTEESNTQEKIWIADLNKIMEDLSSDQVEKLKQLMRNCVNRESIPLAKLEKAKDSHQLANLAIETWGFKESVKAINEFMERLPRRDHSVTELLEPYLKKFDL